MFTVVALRFQFSIPLTHLLIMFWTVPQGLHLLSIALRTIIPSLVLRASRYQKMNWILIPHLHSVKLQMEH